MSNQRKTTRRVAIGFGIFMSFVMVASVFAPMLSQQVATVSAPPVQPTERPIPTFPPPPSLENITFDTQYLHPTGLFAVSEASGWEPSSPVSETNRASATFINRDLQSVIEASVESPDEPIATLNDLDARFTTAYLETSWQRYSSWEEAGRTLDEENGQLQIDFNLTQNRQTYVARQVVWLDDGWIQSVRVITPSNATQLLVGLLEETRASLETFRIFETSPFEWAAHYDAVRSDIIRYPDAWTLADAAEGRPTSISTDDGIALRIETEGEVRIGSENEAEAWVGEAQPGAEILSVWPADQRGEGSGYSVAYSFRTLDGEPRSGFAVLLNAPDGTLHVANLNFPAQNADLNAADSGLGGFEATLAEVMSTFSILPPLSEETAAAEADAEATESAG